MNAPTNVSSPPGLSWDDLPLWMRQARRRVDWGLVYALLLGLLSAWPFLARGGLPQGTALELYVYRAAEMADVMAQGDLLPRWAPNLMYGYGLPLFQFTPPLSSYLPAAIQLAAESDAVQGVRLALVIAAVGGVAGMFAFVRRHWGVWAALIAALAYAFSPPLLFLLPYVYGDLPLLLALQWLPGLLWAVDRVLIRSGGRDLLLLALLAALVILTDTFCALWMLPLAAGWAAWHGLLWRTGGREGARPNVRLALAGLLLGLGLAAVYWLPAALEQGDIHWLAVPLLPGHPLTFGELLSPSTAPDVAAFVPLAPRNLGLALWGLALAGLAGLAARWRHRDPQDRLAWYFALLLAGLAIWLLAGAAGRLLPQQVLALLVFPLALLAGQATRWADRLRVGWRRTLGLAALLALPLLAALPTLTPPLWAEDFASGVNTRLRLELKNYGLATVPPGGDIPLPAEMELPPSPARPLVESYFAGQSDRVNRAAIVGNEVDVLEHLARTERLMVQARTALTLPLYLSAFAAWEVLIDGRPEPREVGAEGLLEVPVPVGEHEVAVTLRMTAAASAGWLVSGVALLLIALIGSQVAHRRPPDEALPLLAAPEARAAGLSLGVCLLLLPLLLSQPGLFWRESTGGVIQDASAPLRYYSQAGLDLLGYDADQATLRAGESLGLRLFWRAVRSPSEDLQVSVTLVSQADGQRVAQSQKRHVGGYPTTLWPLDHYVRDEHYLSIPEDAPPGVYQLTVELWQCQAVLGACSPEQRLLLFDERAQSVGQSLVLPLLVTVQ